MKKLIAIFILMSVSLPVFADQTLSKKLIESWYDAGENLESMEQKYPKILKRVDEFSLAEASQMIEYIKKSEAFSDIKSNLSSSGFKSLADFFDVQQKITGGMGYLLKQRQPEGMNWNDMEGELKKNLKIAKEGGSKGMIIMLEETLEVYSGMRMAEKTLTDKDKLFLNGNADWFMSLIPEEDVSGDER